MPKQKTIVVNGKRYRGVPWLADIADDNDECHGCAFHSNGCINDETNDCCDEGNAFGGMVFIPDTKQGLADYIALKLGVSDEPETAPEQTNL